MVSCSLQPVKNLEDPQLLLLYNITDLLSRLSAAASSQSPQLLLLLNITDLLSRLSAAASSLSRIWKIPS